MKIGVLGGSFNPPHKAHLNIAVELLDKRIVDKVIFMPNIYNPLGKKSIDPKHRLEMLKLMIKNKPSLEVSNIEIEKTIQNYTYQTLDELQSIYPDDDIMLIIGSDNLNIIDKWMKYDYLLNKYSVIVIKRDNDDINNIINDLKLNKYKRNLIIYDNGNSSNFSSTYIRKLLYDGKDVSNYVDIDIIKYIKDNNLYL